MGNLAGFGKVCVCWRGGLAWTAAVWSSCLQAESFRLQFCFGSREDTFRDKEVMAQEKVCAL